MGLLGPSKKEVWKQLAKEIDAEYIEGKGLKGVRVVHHHRSWTVFLDTFTVSNGQSSTTFTRMRIPFINLKGFHFKIYRKGFFSKIGKVFGMQDVEIGHGAFDDAFIKRGSNETHLKKVLRNRDIRRLIEKQKRIKLEIKKAKGVSGSRARDNESVLSFVAAGVIKDIDRLKHLFELLAVVMDALEALGLASDQMPQVKLYKE